MQYLGPNKTTIRQYVEGVLNDDLVVLAQAISLMESSRPDDHHRKIGVLEGVLHKTGNALKVGITGAPGVGKSTFIESLGLLLTEQGKKIAVLTIDPSSQRSRGSILGDKTRMEKLSKTPGTFIRPSAAGKSLGGVARYTRESILLCEAAGYEIIVVETVGVGQSEVQVRDLVDYILLLMISGAGDELQGLKKGIIETADGLAINKAEENNLKSARLAKATFENALHYLTGSNNQWNPKVFICSALEKTGLSEIWENIELYHKTMKANGFLSELRAQQRTRWMDDCIRLALAHQLQSHQHQGLIDDLKQQVKQGTLLPNKAAELVMEKLIGQS